MSWLLLKLKWRRRKRRRNKEKEEREGIVGGVWLIIMSSSIEERIRARRGGYFPNRVSHPFVVVVERWRKKKREMGGVEIPRFYNLTKRENKKK